MEGLVGREAERRQLEAVLAAAREGPGGVLALGGEPGIGKSALLAEHSRGHDPFERARTELCLGERLRRAGRPSDAREPLRSASETFEALGAEHWARRARSEIRASGGFVEAPRGALAGQLTPQELQVALAVTRGATNREAAAALFISPKTVEAHLGRIYRKLGVRGRTELAALMADRREDLAA